MAQVKLDNTEVTGVNTLSVATSTTFNGVVNVPTAANGDVATNIANTSFVSKNSTKPKIDFITKSGLNSIFILSNGVMYSAKGQEGTSAAWGSGVKGATPFYGVKYFRPVLIPNNNPVVKIGGGYAVGYALCSDGSLYTWGNNNVGNCGLNNVLDIFYPTLSTTGVVDVYDHPSNQHYAIDNNRLFIKKTDGYIYGTGYNINGAIGDATIVNKQVWTQLTSLGTNVIGFWNLGSQNGCSVAQKSDGTIWVTGFNISGNLGLGTITNVTSWTNTGTAWNNGDYTMIIKQATGNFGWWDGTTANNRATLNLFMDNGTTTLFKTCGDNSQGQVGNNTLVNVSTPFTPVIGAGRIKEVANSGGDGSVFVLLENGNLWAWANNDFGQLGNGGAAGNVLLPALNTTGVTKLFMDGFGAQTNGWYVQSFIQKDGWLFGTGYNVDGQLGINTLTTVNTWQRIKLPGIAASTVKTIGRYATRTSGNICVFVTEDNSMFATGYNTDSGIVLEYDKDTQFQMPVLISLDRSK